MEMVQTVGLVFLAILGALAWQPRLTGVFVGLAVMGLAFGVGHPHAPFWNFLARYSSAGNPVGIYFVGLLVGVTLPVWFFGLLDAWNQKNRGFFWAFLAGFILSAGGTFLADGWWEFFTFWELMSFFSFLLIGIQWNTPKAVKSAVTTFLAAGVSGLSLLGALLAWSQKWEIVSWSQLWLKAPSLGKLSQLDWPYVLPWVVAIAGKSSQWPFHFWLPRAMAAPTAVSALLHSATLVKAGPYLALLLDLWLDQNPWWQGSLWVSAGLTLGLAAWEMLKAPKGKSLVALSTQMVLSLILILVAAPGLVTRQLALVLIMAHGLYKSLFFLWTGLATGKKNDWLQAPTMSLWDLVLSILVGLTILGLLPSSAAGAAKTQILGSEVSGWIRWVVMGGLALALVPVALMILAAVWMNRSALGRGLSSWRKIQPLWIPMVVSMGFNLFWWRLWLQDFMASTRLGGNPRGTGVFWFLWLLLSLVLAWARKPLSPRDELYPLTAKSFDQFWEKTLAYAHKLLKFWQDSPVWRDVQFIGVAVILGLVWSLRGLWFEGWPLSLNQNIAGLPTPFLGVGVVMVIGASVALLKAQGVLSAIIFMGVFGVSVAWLFGFWGAPDLAFTQVMVEVLSASIFVYVARRFWQRPPKIDPFWKKSSFWLSGLLAFLLTVTVAVAINQRLGPPISDYYLHNTVKLAQGRNIVNVIVVDFRGFDTMGEISVFTLAGLAIVALLRWSKTSRSKS